MDHIKLTQEVLSVDEVTRLVTDPGCGAVSLFVGTTRDNFQGQTVVRLEYEAYQEMAEKEMLKLCKSAREKWALQHIAIYHRLGVVPVTESSVIIAVSSVHRHESLEAVSFLIDELKANVPIWKKEIYNNGSGDWKKNKECQWANGKGPEAETKVDSEETCSGKRALDDNDNTCSQPIKKIKTEHLDETKSLEYCSQDKDSSCNSSKVKCEPDNHETERKINPAFVQIVVPKKELDRRIAAFQQRKRQELDVLNVQEFCTLSGGASTMSSCARTSAVVHRSKDSNSHLKLTKVVNEWGPQTRGIDPGSKPIGVVSVKEEEKGVISSHGSSTDNLQESSRNIKQENSSESVQCKTDFRDQQGVLPEGIEERLHNVESHLKIVPGGPVPQDIYTRLKAVEDRLLHLEGISPEYFGDKKIKIPEKQSYKKEIKAVEDDISLSEIDLRIHHLKMKLKQRQIKQVI